MKTETKKLSYVLITPAHNEETHIEKTLHSVISQTILPQKWIIVSDGSIDRTDKIVKKYIKDNPWIEFIRISEHNDRNFAHKVYCFNKGFAWIKNINYDIIGNLDADVSFDADYFEYLIDKFGRMPELGVAGTPYVEGSFHSFKDSYVNIDHVHGQIQMFRRQCFEDIGGYIPIKGGGIDWVAVTTARMKGWNTYSFQDKYFTHHRKMGTGSGNIIIARFKQGKQDYFLGGHPVWELFRGFFQITRKPYIIGGILLLLGYFWGLIACIEKPLSKDLIEFHRHEQMKRLRALISNRLKLN